MITKSEALACCAQHFSTGPEELARRLEIPVVREAFGGSDGWCLRIRSTDQAIITLNSTSPRARQRFTLAHELAHLVLGTESDMLPSGASAFFADTKEEKQANNLAAEFLLPLAELRRLVMGLPVDAFALNKIAKQADVSLLMGARRVAEFAERLGLLNGAVVLFERNEYKWRWSPTLKFSSKEAVLQIWREAKKAAPQLYREKQADGDVICASYLPGRDFTAMFVQLLPRNVAGKPTIGEQLRDLEAWLFGDDPKLQRSLAGKFGYFSDQKARGMSPEEASGAFITHYRDSWPAQWTQKMDDPRALEWLKLKFTSIART